LREKRLFRRLEIPTTEFAEIANREELDAAVKQVGLPAMLKTCRMATTEKANGCCERRRTCRKRGWSCRRFR